MRPAPAPGGPSSCPCSTTTASPRARCPLVTVPDPPPREVADVAVVREGTALQVTPVPGRRRSGDVHVRGVGRRAQRHRPPSRSTSSTPAATRRPAPPPTPPPWWPGAPSATTCSPTTSTPRATPSALVDVRLAGEGAFTFRTDGEVSYTAPGGITGEQTVTYTVADEFGPDRHRHPARSSSPARASTWPPPPATTAPRSSSGAASASTVLANDSDPNGDPLTVAEVTGAPADLDVRREGNGRAERARPAGPAPSRSPTRISDGEAQGRRPGARRRPPRRRATGRRWPCATTWPPAPACPPSSTSWPTTSTPTATCWPSRRVTSPNPFLSVALLDLHVVRVTAPAGFAESIDVRYTVSDGQASAEGVLVVRPYDIGRVDQAPVVADDEVSVRAGNVTARPRARQRPRPRGRAAPPACGSTPLADGQGQVFIQDDQLRVQAPAAGHHRAVLATPSSTPAATAPTVGSPSGSSPPTRPTGPRSGPLIEARAFAGSEITIPVRPRRPSTPTATSWPSSGSATATASNPPGATPRWSPAASATAPTGARRAPTRSPSSSATPAGSRPPARCGSPSSPGPPPTARPWPCPTGSPPGPATPCPCPCSTTTATPTATPSPCSSTARTRPPSPGAAGSRPAPTAAPSRWPSTRRRAGRRRVVLLHGGRRPRAASARGIVTVTVTVNEPRRPAAGGPRRPRRPVQAPGRRRRRRRAGQRPRPRRAHRAPARGRGPRRRHGGPRRRGAARRAHPRPARRPQRRLRVLGHRRHGGRRPGPSCRSR